MKNENENKNKNKNKNDEKKNEIIRNSFFYDTFTSIENLFLSR